MVLWAVKMVCVNLGRYGLEGCRVIDDDISGFGIVLDQLWRSIGRALDVVLKLKKVKIHRTQWKFPLLNRN
jgi:hypothetical protein